MYCGWIRKRVKNSMNYILLNKIGQGVIKVIPIVQLEKLLQSILAAGGRRKPANELLPAAGAKSTSDRTDIKGLRAMRHIS